MQQSSSCQTRPLSNSTPQEKNNFESHLAEIGLTAQGRPKSKVLCSGPEFQVLIKAILGRNSNFRRVSFVGKGRKLIFMYNFKKNSRID